MSGNIVSQLAYESFGQRRSPTDAESLKQAVNEALMQNLGNITEDGFTGHDMLSSGFIHMQGRVYDPVIGRFLSPDPIVQAPYFSQ
ncbi:RHS repeat domain-containing protein, partial [Catenovulum sediminis]